jgi:GT2 family glycosyltransferase
MSYSAFKNVSPFETGWLSGAAMLLRLKAVINVGMFDASYFAFMEETDLEQRMKRLGWKLCCVPKAVIYHLGSASTDPFSRIRVYGWTRNKFLFLKRYASYSDVFLFAFYYVLWYIPLNLMLPLVQKGGAIDFDHVARYVSNVISGTVSGILEKPHPETFD